MNDILPIDLYHGTSTVFLDSIIEHGLAGMNPVKEWKLLDLSREVFALSEEHLRDTDIYQVSYESFRAMTQQSNEGTFNWQHGDTYVSASIKTAERYAINKRYGSELLTYTIDFLNELIKLKIPYVVNDLYRTYSKIFGLIEANPSPMLVQIKNVPVSYLLNEHGKDCKSNIEKIYKFLEFEDEKRHFILQQNNFRLTKSIQKENLTLWFVNITERNFLSPKYNLYKLSKL